MMHRYRRLAACAMLVLGFSACDKREGALPKTDGSQMSQTSGMDEVRM
jgi:hypothetical protein